MRRVGFHPEARAELRAATEFYERERLGLGREFAREVHAVLDRLASGLGVGRTPSPGPAAPLARFPGAVCDELDVHYVVRVTLARTKDGIA